MQRSFRARVERLLGDDAASMTKTRALVAVGSTAAPFFRAVPSAWRAEGETLDAIALAEDAAAHLGIRAGDDVWMLPLE